MTKNSRKPRILKGLRIFGFVMLAIIVLYITFYVVFNIVSPNLTVKYLGYKSYTILSESMKPELERGDLVMVTKADFDSLQEGDTITFVDPHENVVTHKFVKYEYINGIKAIRTTGIYRVDDEGNEMEPQQDYWAIPESRFIGKVAFKMSGFGHVVLFIQSWFGIAIILLIVIAGAGIYFVVSKLKDDKAKEKAIRKELDKTERVALKRTTKENIKKMLQESKQIKEEPIETIEAEIIEEKKNEED